MSDANFQDLGRFVSYATKQFNLPLLGGCLADRRVAPEIPSRAVGLSLLLGEVVHCPSLLQLEQETGQPQWQRLVGYPHPISDDTFAYASDRMDPDQLRRGCVYINRMLKRGKSLERNKVQGLLVVSIDANEQFCTDHRCCDDCLNREVVCKDAKGGEFKKVQYYHKQVYAQLSGTHISVILDFEPLRQGEEECGAALRMLRRIRRMYGARFFDVVVVDSWYSNGPFLKTVVEELGWPVVAVLKQERFEVYQETMALGRDQKAGVVERDGRQVEIWDVRALRFSDSYPGPVRTVRTVEKWTEHTRKGNEWQEVEKEQNWIWVVAGDLDAFGGEVIRDIGHLRWRIENNAFGELTQHWNLTHCAHHQPVAVVALLWIKIMAFTLFHAFAILHGKHVRAGRATLQELRERILRSLLCGPPVLCFSG
ncbi:MAG: transposase [Verrucomicrobiota bacterium]|jgi:hypothetical protein